MFLCSADDMSSGRGVDDMLSGRGADDTSSGRGADDMSSGRGADDTSSGRGAVDIFSMIEYIKSTRDDVWMTLALSVRKEHIKPKSLVSSARRPHVVRTRLQFPDYFKLNSRGQLC